MFSAPGSVPSKVQIFALSFFAYDSCPLPKLWLRHTSPVVIGAAIDTAKKSSQRTIAHSPPEPRAFHLIAEFRSRPSSLRSSSAFGPDATSG
jgi:hypothetical protein